MSLPGQPGYEDNIPPAMRALHQSALADSYTQAAADAEWVIQRCINEHVALYGNPPPSRFAELCRRRVTAERPEGELLTALQETNNWAVFLIRSAIERDKAQGAPTVRARPGLRLPEEWQIRYEVIYTARTFDWWLSSFLQNAFFGNPLAGEDVPWRSK